MIAALVARFGLSRGVVGALAVAGLLALAGLGFWGGMEAIDTMQASAAAAARAERDAHWKSEIEKSNAEVERVRADQARRVIAIEASTGAEIARLTKSLSVMEARNAALPGGGACGLGRDRIRLLPN